MTRIRDLAAGLLCLTGIVHVAQLAVASLDAATIITALFGLAYLAIGIWLWRGSKIARYLGGGVPLVGLLLALAGMLANLTLLAGVFMAIDVVIVACCIYLIRVSGKPA